VTAFVPGRFLVHFRQAADLVGAAIDEAAVRAALFRHDVPLRSGAVFLRAGRSFGFGFRCVPRDSDVVGMDFDATGRPVATWTRADFVPWRVEDRTPDWLHEHGILNGAVDDILLSQAASALLVYGGVMALDVPYLSGNPHIRRPDLPWRLMRFRNDAPSLDAYPLFNVAWSLDGGGMTIEKSYSGDATAFFAEMGLDLSHPGD
jgi:hypothetical protein